MGKKHKLKRQILAKYTEFYGAGQDNRGKRVRVCVKGVRYEDIDTRSHRRRWRRWKPVWIPEFGNSSWRSFVKHVLRTSFKVVGES